MLSHNLSELNSVNESARSDAGLNFVFGNVCAGCEPVRDLTGSLVIFNCRSRLGWNSAHLKEQ
jgi:hypothetical protein